MALRPLEDKVLLKIDSEKSEKTTASGLVIASLKEDKPTEGIVVAHGPGIVLQDGSRVEPDFKVGDKVIYAKFAGTEISHNGEDLLLLTLRDIQAVVED
jgi:chaperonin GroES